MTVSYRLRRLHTRQAMMVTIMIGSTNSKMKAAMDTPTAMPTIFSIVSVEGKRGKNNILTLHVAEQHFGTTCSRHRCLSQIEYSCDVTLCPIRDIGTPTPLIRPRMERPINYSNPIYRRTCHHFTAHFLNSMTSLVQQPHE